MAYRPAISVSGGQRLKVLKNGDFLIWLFLSLNEGVRGRLSPDKQSALATFKAAPQGGGYARGVMKNNRVEREQLICLYSYLLLGEGFPQTPRGRWEKNVFWLIIWIELLCYQVKI